MKNGIIQITKNNKVILQKIAGYSHLPTKTKINQDTTFPLASGGKSFVAVGIMVTVEMGLLSLETKLKEVVTIPLHQIDGDITIFQLLTHTSGVYDYCDESVFPDYADLWINFPNYKIRSSEALLPLFIDKPMKYEKGDHFEYNNSAYVLLGLVLENIHQKPFDQFLKEAIFEPLAMNQTGYYELDRLPENVALGYLYDDVKDEYYSFIYSIDVKGTGAGGVFSSAPDIERFFQGLLTNKILSEESRNLLFHPHIQLDDGAYGLGFWIDQQGNPSMVGADPGATFISRYLIKEGVQITAISNMAENVYEVVSKYQKNVEEGENLE